MERESKIPTPTEVIVKCMDDFSTAEPEHVIVLWTAEDGSLNYKCNSNYVPVIIGLLRMGTIAIENDFRVRAAGD